MEHGSSPLSEAEQRRLRSIEDDLSRDPGFAAVFDDSPHTSPSPMVDVDRVLGAGLVLGPATIGLGLAWDVPLLGLAGFGATVAAADRLAARHHPVERTIAWWRRVRDEESSEP